MYQTVSTMAALFQPSTLVGYIERIIPTITQYRNSGAVKMSITLEDTPDPVTFDAIGDALAQCGYCIEHKLEEFTHVIWFDEEDFEAKMMG